MKFILIWGVLVCAYASSYAQIMTIKDQENNRPLEMVLLESKDLNVSVITNTKGQADISALQGAEQIEVNSIGYKPTIKSYAELEALNFELMLTGGISLDEIVVSGTRWKQHKREIPSKIISISPKEVALQNPQTAADLLSNTGEVYIQKSQLGGGSPMIRGFATNRLLMSVDGVRMNTAIFRSGNIQNIISLDPLAIEHSEVFFGPGSVMYGSDAIGGVMSFQTLTPQFSYTEKPFIGGKSMARYSSANNERTGHFDVNIGWKKWASVTSFSYSQFDHLRMGSHGPSEYLKPFYVKRQDNVDVVETNEDPLVQKPTAYSQMNLMQKVRFSPSKKWDFQYGFHYSTTSNYARYDRLTRVNGQGIPRSAEWNYGPQTWMMNNLSATHTQKNTFYDKLCVRVAHQYFEESRIDRNFNSDERFIRVEKVNAYSASLDFNKTVGLKHKFIYGLEVVHNDVNSIGKDEDISTGITVDGPSRYPKSTWSSYGAFLNYQFKVSEKVLVQAGARYNQYVLNADFDTTFYPFPFTSARINNGAFTGSLGAVYTPSDKWTISTHLSSGFRSPNVDDIGKVFDSEPGSVVVPNPNLKAEYAYNAELSISKIIGEHVKVDVTGYYTLLDNALVRRDFQLNGQDSIEYSGTNSKVQAIQNAATAYVYGIQTGLEVKLPAGFGIISRFNFQEGREELDDKTTSPLRHAAPWFGVSRLTYTANQLSFDFNIAYSGEVSFLSLSEDSKGSDYLFAKDGQGNPYAPGWYTLNVKAMYQINEQFSVSAGVENLTDQRYRTYTSGIASAGRNFIIALRANF